MLKKYIVKLKAAERKKIQRFMKKNQDSLRLQKRAKVILATDCGRKGACKTDAEISKEFNITTRTIERLRKRYVEDGLDFALDGKARGKNKSPKISKEIRSYILALSCKPPPKGHKNWSLRLLAEKLVELNHVDSISHESIRKVLNATEN